MMNAMITKMIKKWKNKYFKDFQCVAGSVLHNSKDFIQSSDRTDIRWAHCLGASSTWRGVGNTVTPAFRLRWEEFPSTFKFSRKGRTSKECDCERCANLCLLRQYLPQRVLEALWSAMIPGRHWVRCCIKALTTHVRNVCVDMMMCGL